MSGNSIQITVLSKDNGPLSKKISLGADGKRDGSACVMGRGKAKRAPIDGLHNLAQMFVGMKSNEAITLGRLRSGLPDDVNIVVKSKVNGGNSAIARISANFVFEPNHPAVVLLDFDMKGMTPDVDRRIKKLGGFWPALVHFLPELATITHLIRKSTSAGIMNVDTGEAFPGSGGEHCFVVIKDGTDVERFLTTLHERCWLAGLGWMMVGAGGQMLERSIVDKMVGAPERIVFEGPPIVDPPLRQAERKPLVFDGYVLDTIKTCLPLTVVERQNYNRLKAVEAEVLKPERMRVKEEFISSQSQRLMTRTGMTAEVARAIMEKQTQGILLASIELPFDDPELEGKTVGDVLDDPARYEGETLADPLEGVSYGRCKAKVMRGSDGPFINSFAHGHAIYRLKNDATSVRKRIALSDNPVDAFIRLALIADLDEIETAELAHEVARRSGAGVRTIMATLKTKQKDQRKRQKEERRQRLFATRGDPRPILERPSAEAEWLPVIGDINEVVAGAEPMKQSRRDIDGTITQERLMPISETHAFAGSNEEE